MHRFHYRIEIKIDAIPLSKAQQTAKHSQRLIDKRSIQDTYADKDIPTFGGCPAPMVLFH